MKTRININVTEAYCPFYIDEKLFEFDAVITESMNIRDFDKIDAQLSLASNDYIRLDFATCDDDEFGRISVVYGVSVVANYAKPEQICAAADVLEKYGFSVVFDEETVCGSPCADLPVCYWEE